VVKASLGAFVNGSFGDRDVHLNLHGNPIVPECR
jgi:hypothetical protein